MEQERKNFIYGLVHEDGSVECEGAVKRGVNEKIANELFDEMSSFASYAFNKSHAAAYAYVAYQTAWLKCHYPCEFMAALLTSVLDSAGKVSGYIAECSRIHIAVLPPHVNESLEGLHRGGRPHPFRPARRQKSRQGLYQRNFGGAENRWALYFLFIPFVNAYMGEGCQPPRAGEPRQMRCFGWA